MTPTDPAARPTPPGDDAPGLQVALRLQDAFAQVAEQVFPSVVGISGCVREEAESRTQGVESKRGGSWREGRPERRLYPGFRRTRSGSGFLVSADGDILTAGHVLTAPNGDTVDGVDVELPDGIHLRARIIGIEPTLDLTVVRLVAFSRTRLPTLTPARIGDSDGVRVGHWTIALGNPWGPGTTYVVGTLSSQPERQCYQENLTATLMQSSLRVPVEGYGGPLVNIEGGIVGMTVPGPGVDPAVRELPARTSEFALPINLAMGIYRALKVKESQKSPLARLFRS